MIMQLGQSSVIPVQTFPQQQSIIKKISNYIFRFEDKIGQGNFSKVYKGYHQITNQQVAIKIIELSSVKSAKLQELLFSEIEVIQSLNHVNILKCYQVLKSEHNCYIITELCNGGDLQSLLKKQKCLNQKSAFSYIRDIFKGLLYLGQRGIVHRDVKIANIFMHNGACKIADFGFAKYTNNKNFYDLDIGSPLYMSPQGMIDHLYGMKTDIWAFGIILYELLHGKTPFSFCTSEFELKKVVLVPLNYNNLRSELSIQVRQLILKCLIVDHNNRPNAVSLVTDPYIKMLLYENSYTNETFTHQASNQQIPLQQTQKQTLSQNIPNQVFSNQLQPPTQFTNKSVSNGSIHHFELMKSPPTSYNQPQEYQKSGHLLVLNHSHNHSPSPTQITQLDYSSNNSPIRVPINKFLSKQGPLIYDGADSRSKKSQQLCSNSNNLTYAQQNNLSINNVSNFHGNNLQTFDSLNQNSKTNNNIPQQYTSYQIGNTKLAYSPSIQTGLHRAYENTLTIQKGHSPPPIQPNEYNSPTRYPKSYHNDYILTPEQLNKRLLQKNRAGNGYSTSDIACSAKGDHSNSKKANQKDNNFDKSSNSSWSNENQIKKKFPKVMSYENVNKVQNTLHVSSKNSSANKKSPQNHLLNKKNNISIANPQSSPYINTSNLVNANKHRQTSKNSDTDSFDYSLNLQTNNKKSMNNLNSLSKQLNVKDFVNNKQTNRDFLTVKDQTNTIHNSSKKFGELIKGNKYSSNEGGIKSTIKLLDKTTIDGNVNSSIGNSNSTYNVNSNQRNKTKSFLKYQPNPNVNKQLQYEKKRPVRHSIAELEMFSKQHNTQLLSDNMGSSLNDTFYKGIQNNQIPQFLFKSPSQSFKSPQIKKFNKEFESNQILDKSLRSDKVQKFENSEKYQKRLQNNLPFTILMTSAHQKKQEQKPLQKTINNNLQLKNQQLKNRNLIITIMQFKEAIGFLHYCRLYYRFITTFKKLLTFQQIYKYNLLNSIPPIQELQDTYNRFLLTILNQLIDNIKSKEIIYDGQSYKKKKLKEDKLKEVTEEYYRKYHDEINKYKKEGNKIEPSFNRSTTLEYIKSYNETVWQKIDHEYYNLIKTVQSPGKGDGNNSSTESIAIGQTFIKLYRNLCYFSLKITQANAILFSCIHSKSYSRLSEIMIQNWLAQQFYSQDLYFRLKSEYLKRIQEAMSELKGSETNQTAVSNS